MRKNKLLRKIKVLNKSEFYDEEELLIIKSQQGDDNAFESLIDYYEEYLYKMAFLYVKNTQDALDIYQDTVLKAYLNISKLKNTKSFKPWITRILINNTYSKYQDSNFNIAKYNLDENSISDYSYVDIDERLDLYNAIDILETKYKTPILLQYFYDLTIKQISEITNTNENTVKTNIRRGKKKMYYALKEDYDG